MGPGMVIDLEHLFQRDRSGSGTRASKSPPRNLKISDRATVCMPYHKLMDCLEEDRLADKKFGSTRRGIAPVYADKYMKKAMRMGDLMDLAALRPASGGHCGMEKPHRGQAATARSPSPRTR